MTNRENEELINTLLTDNLSEVDEQQALQLMKTLDYRSVETLHSFGYQAQNKLIAFSNKLLEYIGQQDIEDIGGLITSLMTKLNNIDVDELNPRKPNLFTRIFKTFSISAQEIVSRYQKTGAQIDRISVGLERGKNILTSDIHYLDKMYELNKDYFHSLTLYIAAGERKLDELKGTTLPRLNERAKSHNDGMRIQEVNNAEQYVEMLDKRIYDLKVSREITLQSATQIRMIQRTNLLLIEKIQSSILTAIPLWRNQVSIALSLLRQRNVLETQKMMEKTTNQLLQKNKKMNTGRTSNDVTELQSLKTIQQKLIAALEETMILQEEGNQERYQVKNGLILLKGNLQDKSE